MEKRDYIALEGVIGAGKTSLAVVLAKQLNGLLVLEKPDDNPFLADFYRDRKRFAFQTQLFFLLSRFKQMENFPQPDLFHDVVISDYIFARDRIFASVNLDERELWLYDKMVSMLEPSIPRPDLVVYLQSSPERLMQNIRIRNREYEKGLTLDYLKELNEVYNRFFWDYRSTSLLIVNADHVDFVNDSRSFDELLAVIQCPIEGTQYYNPKY